MMKITFYDTKPYDREWFTKFTPVDDYKIRFIESKLNIDTAVLAKGSEAICIFVNDDASAPVIDALYEAGVRLILLRCAGYNNVDFHAAYKKIHVVRVPAYSPYAVAEYASGLLLSINRKIHRAYMRTKEYNFSISGFMGMDLNGKTAGIIGTGKIGRIMMDILRGYGMHIIAYDPHPNPDIEAQYVSLDTVFAEADVISLHCPLTPETKHIVNEEHLALMKRNAILVNTSRGALVDTKALIQAIYTRKIGGVALDVYEEEDEYFFEDRSNDIVEDDELVRLMSFPNVIVTSHQAFLTEEAMTGIVTTTLANAEAYVKDDFLANEICYRCIEFGKCNRNETRKNCF